MSTCGLRAEAGEDKRLAMLLTRPPGPASPRGSGKATIPGCVQTPSPPVGRAGKASTGCRAGLTCGVSRAPRRSRSQCRCPGWPAPRLQRARFPVVGGQECMRPFGHRPSGLPTDPGPPTSPGRLSQRCPFRLKPQMSPSSARSMCSPGGPVLAGISSADPYGPPVSHSLARSHALSCRGADRVCHKP